MDQLNGLTPRSRQDMYSASDVPFPTTQPRDKNPESVQNKLLQVLDALRRAETHCVNIDLSLTGPKPEANVKQSEPNSIGQSLQEVLERSQRIAEHLQSLREMIVG